MVVLVLEDDFEFTLATIPWWQPWTTSLMFVPMLIFNMATLEAALANNHQDLLVLTSPLEIALANILVMYSYYWMWRMSNKWCKMDFPYRFLLCLLYDLLAIVPLSPFSSGFNIAWDERSFVCTSRLPEASVSERQISRVFWTIRNSKYLVLRNLRVYLKNCLTDTLCREKRQQVLAFTFKEN